MHTTRAPPRIIGCIRPIYLGLKPIKEEGYLTTRITFDNTLLIFLTDNYNTWLDEMADPVSKQEKRWNPDSGAPAKKMSKEEKKAARENEKAKRIKAREAK